MKSFKQYILCFLIKNKKLDFSQLIFNQIVEIIKGSKRSTHVPYPRLFTLILQYIGISYEDELLKNWSHSFTSSNFFNQVYEDECNIARGMRKWINAPPYECTRFPYIALVVQSEDEMEHNHQESKQEN